MHEKTPKYISRVSIHSNRSSKFCNNFHNVPEFQLISDLKMARIADLMKMMSEKKASLKRPSDGILLCVSPKKKCNEY